MLAPFVIIGCCNLPVVDPDPKRFCLGAGEAQRAARKTFRHVEDLAVGVCNGEMCDEHLVTSPGRVRLKRIRAKRKSEDCQFKTETPPICRVEIAGYVPPFVTKLGMWSVIPGELEAARPGRQLESGDVFGAQQCR
jgi:hypothetical protein